MSELYSFSLFYNLVLENNAFSLKKETIDKLILDQSIDNDVQQVNQGLKDFNFLRTSSHDGEQYYNHFINFVDFNYRHNDDFCYRFGQGKLREKIVSPFFYSSLMDINGKSDSEKYKFRFLDFNNLNLLFTFDSQSLINKISELSKKLGHDRDSLKKLCISLRFLERSLEKFDEDFFSRKPELLKKYSEIIEGNKKRTDEIQSLTNKYLFLLLPSSFGLLAKSLVSKYNRKKLGFLSAISFGASSYLWRQRNRMIEQKNHLNSISEQINILKNGNSKIHKSKIN